MDRAAKRKTPLRRLNEDRVLRVKRNTLFLQGDEVAYDTVRIADLEVPFEVAPIVAVVFEVTLTVLTAKVPVVLPAAIVTEVGIEVALEDVEIEIARPFAGAGEVIVTVAVLDLPPTTLAGLSVSDLSEGAEIEMDAL